MNLLRRLRFHLWYYQKPPWDTGISPPELMKFITGHLPGRALDLGCGTGTNVITLALHGWQAVGVDFVPRAVYLARRKARQAGVEAVFLVEDVTRLEDLFRRETHPFDLVLDIGCLHSLSPTGRRLYLQNLDRLLAPQGTFLLYAFFKNDFETTGPGLLKADVDEISRRLSLVQHEDGIDLSTRASAWFIFQKLA